ncbi:Chromosome (plasmid) partitioning protein ParB [hydrothermal vent metagenome]|uniref:Chromosome (Plasmid) partitioning protein ParB n=1 Tax=hydrothermal vent metagenome TaxID=652676 RepID=A0A3B0UJZ9_9ZZZZ
MSKKRGLGRGLGALIPSDHMAAAEEGGVRVVPVTAVSPNPRQPRISMDAQKLAELADSIKEHGLIQPLIVTQADNGYTLIAGERRWRACQLAGFQEVPVVVKEATPQQMLELAIIENVQRADLNPLEEANAYQQLAEDFGFTHEQIGQRMGKGRTTITNLIRLLGLPNNIQEAVANGRISGAHGRALLPLPNATMQSNVMNDIIKFNLSVRQVEARVTNLMAAKKPKSKPRPSLPAELEALQTQFQNRLGTKVNIEKGGKSKGKVIIHYYSDEELQAVYNAIIGDK